MSAMLLGPDARPPGPRWSRLFAWAIVQGVAGVVAVVVAAATTPVRPDIALGIPDASRQVQLAAGVVAWIAFGLVGGMRARPRSGGTVLTFGMPFLVAGTLLGGPLVGGLMGLFSEWELRELRSAPRYGALANHGVAALCAVVAGAIALAAEPQLTGLLPGQPNVVFAIEAALVAFVFTTLNVALVVPTIAFRDGIGLLEASRSYDTSFRRTSAAEAVLGWLMAATYLRIGWWAPVVCILLVLAVWAVHDRTEQINHDPMTGLLNSTGFEPIFRAVHEAAVRGKRAYALLVMDLDRFSAVNNDPRGGHAAGDEVIRAVARRIFASVRSSDVVVRVNRAGDEFVVLFPGVDALDVAVTLASRVHARVVDSIRIRDSGWDTQVGASIGIVVVARGASIERAQVTAEADRMMYEAKRAGGGVKSTVLEAGGADRANASTGPRADRRSSRPGAQGRARG